MKRKVPTTLTQASIPWKKQKVDKSSDSEDQEPFVEEIEVEVKPLQQGLVHYYPKFLSTSFASTLFDHLSNDIEFNQSKIKLYGKEFDTPRLQNWMSDEDISASLYQTKAALPWSKPVLTIKEKLEDLTGAKFDYVLLNWYRDGKDYISYHSDSEAIGEGKNVIASVSVGSTRRFVLRHNKWKEKSIPKQEFSLCSGSLIVMIGDNTQQFWKHTVPKTTKALGSRFNLTFRHS
uniref:Fe2OG dioxygenase domain-containing protein n=1 Tax=Vannella robusta TaxID=1487602 RepID=A0A7S4HKF5_9EUKA|mmetsp:Transcript_1181/g.1468  ORF Transcript_1181/g.1468 Transcript_1181/m.1468 type:complete len:233 (+) Transcript_1181:104-802(+)